MLATHEYANDLILFAPDRRLRLVQQGRRERRHHQLGGQ